MSLTIFLAHLKIMTRFNVFTFEIREVETGWPRGTFDPLVPRERILMNPIFLEIVSLVPGLYGLCPSCEFMSGQAGLKAPKDRQDLNEYPEHLKEDYLFLSEWIRELNEKYGQQILIKIIDAQSFQGVYKSIRFGVRQYPFFIIDHKNRYAGKDKAQLDALIRRRLEGQDPNRCSIVP